MSIDESFMSTGVITLIVLTVMFLVGLFGAAIIGLGFYLGWFRIGSGRAAGKNYITAFPDEDKIRADKRTTRTKAQDSAKQVLDGAMASTAEYGEPAVAPAKQSQN